MDGIRKSILKKEKNIGGKMKEIRGRMKNIFFKSKKNNEERN